jgi:hypothetical protein
MSVEICNLNWKYIHMCIIIIRHFFLCIYTEKNFVLGLVVNARQTIYMFIFKKPDFIIFSLK